ncbi:hypothetical protein [Beduinella massiliensis]|uniref:hypothetical protein n=1 Tax=Beduinella massiliensis TaxID=1852363 RepID=UPI000C81C938
METINQYISSLFAKLPATLDILHLKDTVQEEAQASYAAFVKEGVSENEALGRVISSLGTIDDILKRSGVELPDESGDESAPRDARASDEPYESEPLPDDAEDYLDAQYNISRMNALGVALCICAPVCPIVFDSIPLLGHFLSEGIGVVGFFGCVAVAVMLFIYAGSLQKSWRNIPYTVHLTGGMREELRRRSAFYDEQRATHIALGVGLCIFSPAAPFLFGESFGAGLLFVMVAMGVYMMILSGTRAKFCRKLLRNS